MKSILVTKTDKQLNGVIRLPSSKSISNRLLIIRALSGGNFLINNLSGAGDTVLLGKLLNSISGVTRAGETPTLDCENAGTVLRFLISFTALKKGRWMLTGSERMKLRPVGGLVENLKLLGAGIEYLGNTGFPPLLVKGGGLGSARLSMNADVSSQFISSLLLIAPYLPEGLVIDMKGETVSEPYIDMTIRLMKDSGIDIRKWKHRIKVEPGKYQAKEFTVESDWSAASFWFLAASLAEDVDLTLTGLTENSMQGDSVLQSVFSVLGVRPEFLNYNPDALRADDLLSAPSPHDLHSALGLSKKNTKPEDFYYDFTRYPDIALPVIAACAASGIRGRFEGLRSLGIKESDRVGALSEELVKLGCRVIVSGDGEPVIELGPSKMKVSPGTIIDTYRDHRMAMTFAMLAMKTGSIRIADPDVAVKSYPGFWEDLAKAGFVIGR
jgi:3-phosphoshikimate 1-carboxyvinyltransferase